MDSPDIMQQPSAASSIGAQFLANAPAASQDEANATPTTGQPSATPAPAQAAPAAPSPEQQAAVAQTAKHTAIGKMFHTLATGGTGSSASNFWRTVVGGAFAGIGAANDAPVTARGPYGDVRDTSMGGAASRGFRAGMGQAEQQQDRERKQAQQQKEEQRRDQESKIQLDDAVLRKHADARAQQASIQNSVEHEKRMKELDQNIAAGDWAASQRTAQAAQQQVKFFNDLQDVGATPLSGADGEPLQFSTHEEAEKAAHDNPKFFIGDFKTRTAFDPTTNKYGVYKVPDTDIKNVQLKDPTTGKMHTIPRMSATEYLDYQTRVQGLKKGALEITKIGAEITRLQTDVKASGLYGAALKDLTAATDKDGNVDLSKIPGGSRAVLVEHASKGLEDALRARSAAIEKHTKAVDAGDKDAIDEAKQNIEDATQISRHYGGVLSTITGNKKASSTAYKPADAPLAQGSARYTMDGHSIDFPIGSDAEKKMLQKFPNLKPSAGSVPPGKVAVYGPDGFRTYLSKDEAEKAKALNAQTGRNDLTFIPGPDAPAPQPNNSSSASTASLQ